MKKTNKTYRGKLTSRRKKKRLILVSSIVATAGIITITNLTIMGVQRVMGFIGDPVNQHTMVDVAFTRAVRAEEPTMREWIRQEIETAGLDWKTAECIITKESNWNVWATNWNTNGTIDYGTWQINSVHKNTISVEDRYDYKKATKWAIEKRKRDENWCAWVASKKCGVCK